MKDSVYNPQWLTSNGPKLPVDRATITAWCRGYAAVEPIVNETIEFYTTYSSKFLKIKPCKNKNANTFFKNQIKDLDLTEIISQIVKEYWTVGECYVYSELNEARQMWSRCFIQNPDYILVKRLSISEKLSIFLRPDEKLRSLVLKENTSEQESKDLKKISQTIIDYVKAGENIPLDNFYVSCFHRRNSPYDIRGASMLIPAFKSLILLEKFRNEYDLQDVKYAEQQIKETIGHPSCISSADNTVKKDVIATRISSFMNFSIIPWVEEKMFAPIAKLNDFYEYKDMKKELMFPKLTFDTKKLYSALDKYSSGTPESSPST